MTAPPLGIALDALVAPSFRLGGRRWPFYGLFVCSGIVAGVLFTLGLALASGVPLPAAAAALAAGLLAAGALALGTETFTGREVYTFYHYQLVVLAAGGGALALLDRPFLPVLDLIGPALALVQAFGRLGCLMAGCCHGRPHPWGVRYRDEHADQGFARALVGVPLFPVQAVESLCLFALAGGGAALVLSASPAGSALATYLVGYSATRFALELARGDSARPEALGFSEAQWTAALVLAAAAAAELSGLLPPVPWHLAAIAGVGLTAAATALHHRVTPAHRLSRPAHVSEVAGSLAEMAAGAVPAGQAPRVACTSLGVRLSAGRLGDGRAHYALSARDGELDEATARRLAALILRLRHPSAPSRLLAGGQSIFHLLVEVPTRELAARGTPSGRLAVSGRQNSQRAGRSAPLTAETESSRSRRDSLRLEARVGLRVSVPVAAEPQSAGSEGMLLGGWGSRGSEALPSRPGSAASLHPPAADAGPCGPGAAEGLVAPPRGG